jgi:diaminohydroxyphosphoribosylaminopyrimidine deaminase/5-amino-6-(5-phosphoribosylamino)uracil reductase
VAGNDSINAENYMQRCFQLAKQGNSFTAPNPMVGAVLVYNNRIIGEGYHEKYGEAHAEVNCINSVKEEDKKLIPDSTLFVSLEPCSHFGKRPPCTELILRNKIPNVVISVQDSFHLVNGAGIRKLKENGVHVITGVLENEGKNLIRHFFYFHENKKPFVTLKFAQSKDGFIGKEGMRITISNELSKRYVHQLRAEHQSILVGKNTAITDNPELTVRYAEGKNPIRIILADEQSIPSTHHVFNNDAQTIFINESNVENILDQLFERTIISVLVEGGAKTLQQFIDNKAWNEVHVITSPVKLESGIPAPKLAGKIIDTLTLEGDTVQVYQNDFVV